MATQSIDHAAVEPARELSTLGVVSSAHLVSHLHLMVLPALMYLLTDRMQVSYTELGLALTAFSLVSGLTQAPMGVLVDRIGGRVVLMSGLVLGGAAFASLSVFDSYTWLITAAVLAGLANCVYHPADYSILSTEISERRMGRAFSVHTFAGFAGSAIAPPLLLAIAGWAGVGASFIFAGLCAWAVAALVLLMPAARPILAGVRSAATPGGGKGARSGTKDAARGAANGNLLEVLNPTVLGLTLFFTLLGLSGSAMSSFAIAALIDGHGVAPSVATAALTGYLTASAAGVLAGGPVADRTTRHGDDQRQCWSWRWRSPASSTASSSPPAICWCARRPRRAPPAGCSASSRPASTSAASSARCCSGCSWTGACRAGSSASPSSS